jgi:hypothetical protein
MPLKGEPCVVAGCQWGSTGLAGGWGPLACIPAERSTPAPERLPGCLFAWIVRAWLVKSCRDRTFADLAFALVATCLDERAQTPAAALHVKAQRVAGAARRAMSDTTLVTQREAGDDRCAVVGHETMPRVGCPSCAADAKAQADEEPEGPPELHYAADLAATRALCGRKIRRGMRVAVRGAPGIVSGEVHAACRLALDPQAECVPVPAGSEEAR